jgi:L-rhamnose mutarotase
VSRRYCLALDLKDDPDLIAEYEGHHRKIWPEIAAGIRDAGIEAMEIYRVGNRLFMVMEVSGSFSFEAKAGVDRGDPRVQEWEDLMWTYQQALPMAAPGEKWMLMERIFSLEDQE